MKAATALLAFITVVWVQPAQALPLFNLMKQVGRGAIQSFTPLPAPADLAVDLLIEKAGLAAEEARALIDERATDEKLRILIVDDELAMGQLVKTSLADYEVDEASDGEEALAAIRADRPDLVISDIRTSGMDGFALANRLKEEFPDVPVIALSENLETKDGQDHNFVGFLEKPIRIEQIQQMIEGALGQGD